MGAVCISEAQIHHHGTPLFHRFSHRKVHPTHEFCGPGKSRRIRDSKADDDKFTLTGRPAVQPAARSPVSRRDSRHRRAVAAGIQGTAACSVGVILSPQNLIDLLSFICFPSNLIIQI